MGCEVYAPPEQMSAIVRTESSANLYAIGIVKHLMNRQPQSLTEALQVVQQLRMEQHNYSVGLAQVNQSNFATYGLHDGNMFDKCSNLRAGSKILSTCYNQYKDWPKAYSCYYSGRRDGRLSPRLCRQSPQQFLQTSFDHTPCPQGIGRPDSNFP